MDLKLKFHECIREVWQQTILVRCIISLDVERKGISLVMKKQTFLKGALILTIGGIIVKVIGAANRIILSRLLGGEGIGLYQMAYPIYQLALSVSSAGIPVAISILVAEKLAFNDQRGARRVFRISLKLMAATGLIFSMLLYFGASWLIEMQAVRDVRAYYALVTLSPAIFFVTILASYRGYFQGMQQMTPTAVSQIAEQFVRVIVMLFLVIALLPYGLSYAAAGASFGAAPGAVAGVIVLLYYYWKHHRECSMAEVMQVSYQQESTYRIIMRMIKLALPVSLANIMLPITANIDLLIVPARLETAGCSVAEATELFGYLTGMAVSLVNMPTILTASLAASLVPAISESFTLNDKGRIKLRTETALRIANLLMIPSCVGLYLLALPISEMLYATPNAGGSIAILSCGVILLGIGQVTTGVLQGLGHTTIPLINMMFAAVAKLALSWYLTALPDWGLAGAAWATNADFGVAAVLNLYFLYKYVGVGIHIENTCKVLISACFMGVVVLLTYDFVMVRLLSNTLATLTAIFFGGIVYSIVILFTGAMLKRDIESIPKFGNGLAKFLWKLRLIR